MPTTRTEDDIRADKLKSMGDALGEMHFLLWKDLTWLNFEWHQYVELYGTNPSRIEIMNAAAPRFFWSLERVLWQDLLLSLSRLADPSGTGGQQNLTFRRLLGVLPADGPLAGLEAAIDTYEKRSQFARDWRHKLFAHRNLAHASEPDAHPLQHASRASVIAALAAAQDLLNLLELHYQDSTTAYDSVIDPIGGAHDLLIYLDRGLQHRDEGIDRVGLYRARFE